MLAKVETWVSILIFAIWAFSAYLEYQRKKKKKAEAEARQRSDSSADHEASVTQNQDYQTPDFDEEALREAEEAARSQPYRSSRRGEDLEVSVEDIIREILLPEPIEAPPEKNMRSEISEEKFERKFLESEFQAPGNLGPQDASSDFEDEIKDAPSGEVSLKQWNRDSIFSQGFSQAILAAEILSEPRSRKVFKQRM